MNQNQVYPIQSLDKKTRIEFLKELFIQDYTKGIKKNKLLKVDQVETSDFIKKLDRLAFNVFVDKAKSIDLESLNDYEKFIDPAFYAYKIDAGLQEGEYDLTAPDLLFSFLKEVDPTSNKEYLQWILLQYRELIKNRKPFKQVSNNLNLEFIQDGKYLDMLFGGVEYRFFEDLYKVNEALERFNFIKKTRVLSDDQKDINRLDNISSLLKLIKPFMPAEEGSDDVDTLDHKELKCIDNQMNFEQGDNSFDNEPRAKLLFQNNDYIIVHTLNKTANQIFGKYTNWCTAGTRHNSMFDSYDKRGNLFVVIAKGFGSKKSIDADPSKRLQFHFQDGQYMDALDHSIKIKEWFLNNPECKDFFRDYIVKKVLPKKNKGVEQLDFIKNLGYDSELIKIYKEMKVTSIKLGQFKLSEKALSEIGEIVNLKELFLIECNIEKIPDSFKNLKKLEKLTITNNPDLKEIPDWFNELINLEEVTLTGCDISNQFNVCNLKKIKQLALDYNPSLTQFPLGIGNLKELFMLSASRCDIKEISSEILDCNGLQWLDLHENFRLTKIPVEVVSLPHFSSISIDETKISDEDVNAMITINPECEISNYLRHDENY